MLLALFTLLDLVSPTSFDEKMRTIADLGTRSKIAAKQKLRNLKRRLLGKKPLIFNPDGTNNIEIIEPESDMSMATGPNPFESKPLAVDALGNVVEEPNTVTEVVENPTSTVTKIIKEPPVTVSAPPLPIGGNSIRRSYSSYSSVPKTYSTTRRVVRRSSSSSGGFYT